MLYILDRAARGVTGLSPLRMFGLVSAIAILLLTVIYAVCLCILHRSLYLQGGAKNGASLSHCKYSENSMTELRWNWWTSEMLNTVINFLFKNFIALWRHLAKKTATVWCSNLFVQCEWTTEYLQWDGGPVFCATLYISAIAASHCQSTLWYSQPTNYIIDVGFLTDSACGSCRIGFNVPPNTLYRS